MDKQRELHMVGDFSETESPASQQITSYLSCECKFVCPVYSDSHTNDSYESVILLNFESIKLMNLLLNELTKSVLNS